MNAPRTKTVAPWKLREGMRLAPLHVQGTRDEYRLGTIVHIVKGIGIFTRGSVWHVQTDLGERLMYHGRRFNLPAERVRIVLAPGVAQ